MSLYYNCFDFKKSDSLSKNLTCDCCSLMFVVSAMLSSISNSFSAFISVIESYRSVYDTESYAFLKSTNVMITFLCTPSVLMMKICSAPDQPFLKLASYCILLVVIYVFSILFSIALENVLYATGKSDKPLKANSGVHLVSLLM